MSVAQPCQRLPFTPLQNFMATTQKQLQKGMWGDDPIGRVKNGEMGAFISTPLYLMNNQYGGPNTWKRYLTALEQQTLPSRLSVVTEYYIYRYY